MAGADGVDGLQGPPGPPGQDGDFGGATFDYKYGGNQSSPTITPMPNGICKLGFETSGPLI